MDLRGIMLGLAFAVIWSSAFTAARVIVAAAPPLGILALRFAISGLIGVAIARALGQSWRLSRSQWRGTIVFGLCQNALYLGLFWYAMQTVPAGLASIVASTMPLVVALMAWAMLGEGLRPLGIAGLAAGFLGVVVIMFQRVTGGADLWGLGLCVLGTIALAVATLSVRTAVTRENRMMVVGLQMLVGGAALALASMLTEDFAVVWSWPVVGGLVYSILIAGLLATWLWFALVERVGTTKGAAFHFLNPFFGVAIAAVVLGEPVTPLDFLGVAIIAAGILAVQLSRARAR